MIFPPAAALEAPPKFCAGPGTAARMTQTNGVALTGRQLPAIEGKKWPMKRATGTIGGIGIGMDTGWKDQI